METSEESQLVINERKDTCSKPATSGSEGGSVENGPTTHVDRALRYDITAYILVFVGGVVTVVSLSAIQSLDRSIPHAEVNLARFSAQPILMFPYLVTSKTSLRVEHPQIKWIVVATVVLYVCSLSVYGSTYYVAVGSSTSVALSVSLVTLTGINVALGNATKSNIASVIICMTGILLVIQPEFIFGLATSEDKALNGSSLRTTCISFCENKSIVVEEDVNTNTTTMDEDRRCDQRAVFFGYLLAVIGGICSATNATLYNRPLATVNPVVLAFWTSVPAIGISIVQMLATEIPTWPECWFCILMLLIHSFCAAVSAIAYTIALNICTLPLLVSIVFLATVIPGSFAVQYTLLATMYPGHRNWLEYVGATLCLVGAVVGPVWRLWYQVKERRAMQ